MGKLRCKACCLDKFLSDILSLFHVCVLFCLVLFSLLQYKQKVFIGYIDESFFDQAADRLTVLGAIKSEYTLII